MRQLSLFLFLASSAVAALAAPGDHARGARHDRETEADQPGERVQRPEARQDPATERQQAQPEQQRQIDARPERSQANDRGADRSEERFQRRLQDRQGGQHQQRVQQAHAEQPERIETAREWRQRNDAAKAQSSWQPRERTIRTIPSTNVLSGPSRAERDTYQNRDRRDYRDGDYPRWTNNWRNDRRYDWYDYRNQNRAIFRTGTYYDPFGWSYRRWSIGSFMYPSYYGSNYWMNDPWEYRLPPAYGPYHWVRYWNDALLVNIYTGQVVDVLHNFFW